MRRFLRPNNKLCKQWIFRDPRDSKQRNPVSVVCNFSSHLENIGWSSAYWLLNLVMTDWSLTSIFESKPDTTLISWVFVGQVAPWTPQKAILCHSFLFSWLSGKILQLVSKIPIISSPVLFFYLMFLRYPSSLLPFSSSTWLTPLLHFFSSPRSFIFLCVLLLSESVIMLDVQRTSETLVSCNI